jgi:hypothetical protein
MAPSSISTRAEVFKLSLYHDALSSGKTSSDGGNVDYSGEKEVD